MSVFAPFSPSELAKLLKLMEDSLHIARHEELFKWLDNDVQSFLPHDVLIAAWGDFSLGLVHLDVVSRHAGLRTSELDKLDLQPFLMELFARWNESEREPFVVSFHDRPGYAGDLYAETSFRRLLPNVRCGVVQGMKDQRGRQDCLYLALHFEQQGITESALGSMAVLLPYIDAALRQVAHLPVQYPDAPPGDAEGAARSASGLTAEGAGAEDKGARSPGDPLGTDADGNPANLSGREMEIMNWVQMGKTNAEIGSILDLSPFTVKNHMQRIFRKLDVLNRAQAVSKVSNQAPDLSLRAASRAK